VQKQWPVIKHSLRIEFFGRPLSAVTRGPDAESRLSADAD